MLTDILFEATGYITIDLRLDRIVCIPLVVPTEENRQ